jgi:hypothetical protein
LSAHNAITRRWYKARQRELRDLLWEWDPLGLMGAPDDEYDCVVDAVLSALVNQPDGVALKTATVEGLGYMAGQGWSQVAADRHSQPPLLDPFMARVREWWRAVPPPP